jgi:hypothetical protein
MKIIALLFALSLLYFQPFKTVKTIPKTNDDGWIELINGQDFTGWRASEHKETWTVVDGMFQAYGQRSHLYYEGTELKDGFKNFEIEVQVKTFKLANSGIGFHTEYNEVGWPEKGFEIQVNNTHTGEGDYIELKKMASLYGVRNVYKAFAKDGEWMLVKARVENNRVQVWLNGLKTVDYVQPKNLQKSVPALGKGTFCLQGHDRHSKVQYRSFKVRRLSDDVSSNLSAPNYGIWFDSLLAWQDRQFGFIDLHPKMEMKAQELADLVYASGINIAFLKSLPKAKELNAANQYPLFKGIKVTQANFKIPENISFDFIIGESTDLNTAKALLATNKINIWSDKGKNLTAQNAEELLKLANQNSVAIEIDNENKSPSVEIIKLAKAKGLKFTFAGLLPINRIEKSQYIFEAIREAQLNYKDLYIPRW